MLLMTFNRIWCELGGINAVGMWNVTFDGSVLLRVTDYLYDSFTSTCLQFPVSVGNIYFIGISQS